jgi:hypothetical protein
VVSQRTRKWIHDKLLKSMVAGVRSQFSGATRDSRIRWCSRSPCSSFKRLSPILASLLKSLLVAILLGTSDSRAAYG